MSLDKKCAESEGSSQDEDFIRRDSSLSLVNGDDEKIMILTSHDENKSIEEKKRKDKKAENKLFYRPENFGVGDVVGEFSGI